MKTRGILLIVLAALVLAGCSGAPQGLPEARTVSWDEALEILHSGEVRSVFQTHSLDVTFELKDGSIVHTVEESIDLIFAEIDRCGKPCANITLATE